MLHQLSELREFKNAADEILKDIHVTEDLKDKVRARCKSGKKPMNYWSLISAASIVLIIALGGLFGSFSPKPRGEQLAQDNTIMMATQRAIARDAVWQAESLEEAEAAFGESLRIPGYIPEGYALEFIQVYGDDGEGALGVALHYTGNGQTLIIRQEKETSALELSSLSKIEKNGETYYVQWSEADATTHVTLHWLSEGIHYVISGPVSEEEVLNIALSMK